MWAFFLLSGFSSYSQTLEFVQNKGQWDRQVNFKGDLQSGGAFQLQKTGYRVLLNNEQDVLKVHQQMHARSLNDLAASAASRTATPGSHAGGDNGGGGNSTGPLVIHSHVYQVQFANANDTSAISVMPDKPLDDTYNNYFIGNDKSKWASNCRVYQAVVYQNIYPGIDVRYYTNNGALKYDFIVHPGADSKAIALQFDGADKLYLQSGNLHIQTSVGEVSELSPYSYTAGNSGKTEVKTKFVIRKNTVSFQLEEYDKSATLVIDPTLVFSTFTGSRVDNWGFTATFDGQGNLYSGGIVFGNGFPVSNGAFQTTYHGGNSADTDPMDVGIMKFSANGTKRIYATYLGGTGNEQPHSLVVDNDNNLIVAGRTSSGTSFPSTSDKFGPENAGGAGQDIFVTKFNAAGSALIGSRRIGGSGTDGVNIATNYVGGDGHGGASSTRRNYGDDARSEVITDASNNIYLVGQTASTDFPVTTGAFQQTAGGKQDGVVIKTSGNLSNIAFSSYLGGDGDDASFVLSISPVTNNIYVAGGTSSSNFPGVARGNSVVNGSFQGGDCDGFVAIISNDGSQLFNASYFGTPGADLIFGIQFDRIGFPYITGTTTGTWPVKNAAFQQDKGKQFISKLQSDLSDYVYSTVFGKGGGVPDISITAFLVDRCENVYVSGWGGGLNEEFEKGSSTVGLTTTPDALTPNGPKRDGQDFYFFVLKKDAASQLYGSMFGQNGGLSDHVDGGTSRFDKQGVIYQAICANCYGKTLPGGGFPTTAGAWSQVNGTQQSNGEITGCNLAAIKIAFHLAGIGAGLRTTIDGVANKNSGCVPVTVTFTDTLAMGKTYQWSFGDGSPDTTTVVPTANHTYTVVGNYRVRLISIDPAACNSADTAYTNIRVRADRAFLSFDDTKLQPCDSLHYQFTNTSTAPSRPFTDSSFQWDFGDGTGTGATGLQSYTHAYAAAGTYNIVLRLLDTSYCNYPDSVLKQIRISPTTRAQFETQPNGCYPYTAVFNNTSLAGQQFYWDFGDGSTSTDINPTHTYAGTGTFTVRLIVVDPNTCNVTDTTRQQIIVSPNPVAGFTYAPVPPQANTPVTFTNTSTGGTSFNWDFGDGDTLHTLERDTLVQHLYQSTNTFKACLFAANQYGCVDTTCQAIAAIIMPLVDVPTAFTPNGDGVNDIVRVRGYGIDKVTFRIYNRWGVLMFQSNNSKELGWNGTYKGTVQPQDVYTYIADIIFTDGTKYQKKGDITLLR